MKAAASGLCAGMRVRVVRDVRDVPAGASGTLLRFKSRDAVVALDESGREVTLAISALEDPAKAPLEKGKAGDDADGAGGKADADGGGSAASASGGTAAAASAKPNVVSDWELHTRDDMNFCFQCNIGMALCQCLATVASDKRVLEQRGNTFM